MNQNLANALLRYFEALYTLNQNTITLCGVDVIDNNGQFEKCVDDVIFTIPRLVPYKKSKGKEELKICNSDGLLKFSQDLPFMEKGYSDLLAVHIIFLAKVKKIRNKLEHEMHAATIESSGSGNGVLFHVCYKVDDEEITIYAGEMIRFAKQINELFAQIQDEVAHYAFSERKEGYAYYRRLAKFPFTDFNKIYESDLLRTFGKALLPF